jgi:hypothetical protein
MELRAKVVMETDINKGIKGSGGGPFGSQSF